ncbi:MAG TPA: hypothetical protein VEQ60_11640 [Longimicrobium sp.]|nr:hypothetical protein [Longimicrobium sp.]
MRWSTGAGWLLFMVAVVAPGCAPAAGTGGAAAAQTRPTPPTAPAPASARERVVSAEERAARVDVAQRHLRAFFDENSRAAIQPVSGEQGSAAELLAAVPQFVFEEALVQLAPDAAARMDTHTRAAAEAIRAWEADSTQAGLRPPSEVFESTIRLAGAVALAAGDDGTVTAEEAAAALRGLCPLYPFC